MWLIVPSLLTLHIIVCLLLVLVVLMQLPRSEGLGAAFGGATAENIFGAQTTQRAKKYDQTGATENAAISARLPYILASSRFAHYLKVMARDKIGSFMEVEDVSAWLNRWILNYTNSAEGGGQEIRAKFPLREARVEVTEVPGSPGSYNAVAYLRPWLQMEELSASLRLVARIPKKS